MNLWIISIIKLPKLNNETENELCGNGAKLRIG